MNKLYYIITKLSSDIAFQLTQGYNQDRKLSGGILMKIVNLDGVTTNPGDLSWDGMKKLGDFTVYERK